MARSIARRWLMQRKPPGKICRHAALLPFQPPAIRIRLVTITYLDQYLKSAARRGMALA